jgi:hypothetical protein
VFEVEDAFAIAGWADDERVREKMSYGGARAYLLPDAGNGRPAELLLGNSKPCPPGVFEGVDLRRGPCRVTGTSVNLNATDLKYRIQLRAGNGVAAQVIEVPLEHVPRQATLHDSLRKTPVLKISSLSNPLIVELNDQPPGFYRLQIDVAGDKKIEVQIFKAFPLMVLIDGSGSSYQTTATLY